MNGLNVFAGNILPSNFQAIIILSRCYRQTLSPNRYRSRARGACLLQIPRVHLYWRFLALEKAPLPSLRTMTVANVSLT